MSKQTWYALSSAGILALAATGCSSMRSESRAPTAGAQQAQTSQQQSEQALKAAQAAQKAASDQEQRAAKAEADVQKAQKELTIAQQRARQEQEKAHQLQQQANLATQQASQQAQVSQQQAAAALAQESRRVQGGEQIVTGVVMQASPQQLVVQPQGGNPVTMQVGLDTRVKIDGREASASDIQQGTDALVSYQMTGTPPQPNATSVSVMTPGGAGATSGTAESTGAPSSSPSGGSSGTGAPQGATGGSSQPSSGY
jgi:flagellar biosynthesis GTPase FlhF